MSVCRFCFQIHEAVTSTDPGSSIWGIELRPCPNMPEGWVMVDSGTDHVIVDMNEVES